MLRLAILGSHDRFYISSLPVVTIPSRYSCALYVVYTRSLRFDEMQRHEAESVTSPAPPLNLRPNHCFFGPNHCFSQQDLICNRNRGRVDVSDFRKTWWSVARR